MPSANGVGDFKSAKRCAPSEFVNHKQEKLMVLKSGGLATDRRVEIAVSSEIPGNESKIGVGGIVSMLTRPL